MAVNEILKMGDPRLLRVAQPVLDFDTDALHRIVSHWDVVRQLASFPWPPDLAFTATRAQPYHGPHRPCRGASGARCPRRSLTA